MVGEVDVPAGVREPTAKVGTWIRDALCWDFSGCTGSVYMRTRPRAKIVLTTYNTPGTQCGRAC